MISRDIFRFVEFAQAAAIALVGVAAFLFVAATALAFSGVLLWPDIPLSYGGQPIPWFGMAVQIGVTVLFVLLAIYLPSSKRVLRLETSHRKFEIDMDDITRAYRAAHWADRKAMFDMHREFDAVRERYQHLKSQPELAEMDAELLTIAAQMSEQSRELAEMYSDAKIARARESLMQRQADAKTLEDRIQKAHADLRQLKRMMEDVDIEESAIASQMQILRDEVTEMGLFGPEFIRGKPHLKTVAAE